MPWFMLKGFENQHVECAVNEIRFFLGHIFRHPDSLGKQSDFSIAHLDCQDRKLSTSMGGASKRNYLGCLVLVTSTRHVASALRISGIAVRPQVLNPQLEKNPERC